jgi:gamma-glutamyltranspeptidase
MLNSVWGRRGMMVAPHSLAAEAGLSILREGGNAIEAMVAAASTISVVYPHMNSIGGDSFWLVLPPGGAPYAVDACGPAAKAASIGWYKQSSIPSRGPLAANTMAGAVGGWKLALERAGGKMPLSRLLADAIHYARNGFPVTPSQTSTTESKRAELQDQPGFAENFLDSGPIMRREKIAATLERLASAGLDDFYRGDLARSMAADLQELGSPLALEDFTGFSARLADPVTLRHAAGQLFNMTLPTQGVISLAILGIAERAGLAKLQPDSADHVHCLVEATKQAFGLRDRFVTDPDYAPIPAQSILDEARLAECAGRIDMRKALTWGQGKPPSDTVWMGAIDGDGLAVSFIQSIYHEYGSGIVLRGSGVNWQNRGSSFRLDPAHLLALVPGKKPFHTLNPAGARLKDGSTLVYGTMGGDGQPQTQAAVFSRHVVFGQGVQQAVSAPRWLLGRTWGQSSDTLKLEARFSRAIIDDLAARGHEVELYPDFSETMGHAGAIRRRPDGVLEGGADPRSNGAAAGF